MTLEREPKREKKAGRMWPQSSSLSSIPGRSQMSCRNSDELWFKPLPVWPYGSTRWLGHHGGAVPPLSTDSSSVLLDRMGSGILCCNACTCANIPSSNKIQRIYMCLKITACMAGANSEQKTKKKKKKKPNCHF